MKSYFAICLLILSVFGCSAHKHNYAVRIKNIGDQNINGAMAESRGGLDFEFGSINSGKSVTDAKPKPRNAYDVYTLKWKDHEGETYSEVFDLRKEIDRSFKGIIIFKINENNRVTFETRENPYKYFYDITVRNAGKTPIYGIQFCNHQAEDGLAFREIRRLKPKKQAVKKGPSKYPPNGRYTISWKSSTQQSFSVSLDLEEEVKPNYKGDLLFCISKKNELTYHTYPPLYSEFFQHLDVFNIYNIFD